MSMKGSQTPFLHGHTAQFGLIITYWDTTKSAARALMCQFYLNLGRGARRSVERTWSFHAKSFPTPFRCDVYKRHNEPARRKVWAAFRRLTTAEEFSYSEKIFNNTNTLLAHFESRCAFTRSFYCDIVVKVNGDLQFVAHEESVYLTRTRSLSAFKMHDGALP